MAFVAHTPVLRPARRQRPPLCARMAAPDQPAPAAVEHAPPADQPAYDASALIRPDLASMAPYTPIVPYEVLASQLGRLPSDIVKLDANENPYGPSPLVAPALATAPYLHIYPDPASGALRDALATYTGVPADLLMAGAGADELIDLLFRLLVTPGAGHSVVSFPPTFGMYRFDADVNGAELIEFPRDPSTFALPISAVENHFAACAPADRPRMLFVASPNNPDGSVLPEEDLRRLLALPTLVVLDEAYFEFADAGRIGWVQEHSNLVVLRTLSKWAALAGLRVGYGAFPPEIIEQLWKIKQPYNVNVAGQIAGAASLQDKDDLLAKVERLVEARGQFFDEVGRFPWLAPFPSQSNFVLCRVGGGRVAGEVKKALAAQGVLVRYYTSPGLSDCIRISMGTDAQMERLYEALAEL